MSRRLTVLLAAAAALSLTAMAIGTATAAEKAPAKQKMAIVGHSVFKAGKFAFDNQRFSPRKFDIKSGGKVTLRNKAKTDDPHTFSLVKKSQLPDSFDCEVCGEIFAAHGADEQTGDLANPVVDVGAAGFDQPGDSIFVAPHGKVSFDVTAPAGTTLHFICAIHPWMQGRIRVR
jgi:plastocyanin